MNNYGLKIKSRPNYYSHKANESKETKTILELAREVKLLKKQTKFIIENNMKTEDLSQLISKKINII